MSDTPDTPPTEPPAVPSVIEWNAERVRRGKPAVYAKQVPAEPRVPDGPTLHLPVEHQVIACRHEHVYVDAKEREVTCQDCDAILDPIVVLDGFARKEREFYWCHQQRKDEEQKLRAEIEALKKARSEIKAGIRRNAQQKKIAELERAVEHFQSRAYEFERCYREAKAKLEAVGKKAPKLRPQLVGVE